MIEALLKASEKNLQSVVMGHFHFLAPASKQLVTMWNVKLSPLVLKNSHEDDLNEHFVFLTRNPVLLSFLSEKNIFIIKQRNQKVSLCERLSSKDHLWEVFLRVTVVRVKQKEGTVSQWLCQPCIMAIDLTYNKP